MHPVTAAIQAQTRLVWVGIIATAAYLASRVWAPELTKFIAYAAAGLLAILAGQLWWQSFKTRQGKTWTSVAAGLLLAAMWLWGGATPGDLPEILFRWVLLVIAASIFMGAPKGGFSLPPLRPSQWIGWVRRGLLTPRVRVLVFGLLIFGATVGAPGAMAVHESATQTAGLAGLEAVRGFFGLGGS